MQIYRRPTLFLKGDAFQKFKLHPKSSEIERRPLCVFFFSTLQRPIMMMTKGILAVPQECQDALFAQVDLWWAHLFKVGVGHEPREL